MSDNRCLFCGDQIPEGTMVCPFCQKHYAGDDEDMKKIVKDLKTIEKLDKVDNCLTKVLCWLLVFTAGLLLYGFFFYK